MPAKNNNMQELAAIREIAHDLAKELAAIREIAHVLAKELDVLSKQTPQYVELSPTKTYTAHGMHTVNLKMAYEHVIPVPQMGGVIIAMDKSQSEVGILRVKFATPTRLHGMLVLPTATRKPESSESPG